MTAELLTVREVAEALRVNPATVRRWCANGTLAAIKVGRDYRIKASALQGLAS